MRRLIPLFLCLTSLVSAVSIPVSDLSQSGATSLQVIQWDGTKWVPATVSGGGGGSGTVTAVTVTPLNGVSATVANQGTTPALSFSLGAITPSSVVSSGAVQGATVAATGALTAGSVAASGTVTGSNLSGTNTGDQTSVTGNAGTATLLQTSRLINGVSFNGGADITVPAAAGTLTGSTLASGVTASSLTSAAGGSFGTNAFLSTAFAPLASPTFTGVPAAPTATLGTNTTQLATTAYVVANGGVTTGTTGQNAIFGANGTQLSGTSEMLFPLTGEVQVTPGARSASVAPYFRLQIPTDLAITAATEAPGFQLLTATRQFAVGTTAVQREVWFQGPTYTGVGATATLTDAFTFGLTPPIQGANAALTRIHSLGILDSTSAASSITGGLVVATTFGTTATSVGIGGGNVNAGGLITGGTITSTGALTASSTSTFTGTMTSNNAATFNGTNATTAFTLNQTARTSGVLPYLQINIPADLARTTNTASPGIKITTNSRQWAPGTVPVQSEIDIGAPTYTGSGATAIFTKANTMTISGAPIVGTNASMTERNALEVAADNTKLTGGVQVGSTGSKITGIRVGTSGAMTAGVITVADTATTANTRYTFSTRTIGTITVPSAYYASARAAGTSFTITSSQPTDTSTVDWIAYEP